MGKEQSKHSEEDKFFISYNMIEGQFIVNLLYFHFDTTKGSIFLAEKRALNAAWKDYLYSGIESCNKVIVIWTNSYYKTKYTKIEFDSFVEKKKQIFVLVDSENAERARGVISNNKNIKIFQDIFPWMPTVSKILEHECERLGTVNDSVDVAKAATNMMMSRFESIFYFRSNNLLGKGFHDGSRDLAFSRVATSRSPILLIDKEDIKHPETLESIDSLTLVRLALVVGGPTSYQIFLPQDETLDKCTIICMSAWCFEAASIYLSNHREDSWEGEGGVSELLEKVKGTDDVQIFFLPFTANVSGYPNDTTNYIRYVIHVLHYNYNK